MSLQFLLISLAVAEMPSRGLSKRGVGKPDPPRSERRELERLRLLRGSRRAPALAAHAIRFLMTVCDGIAGKKRTAPSTATQIHIPTGDDGELLSQQIDWLESGESHPARCWERIFQGDPLSKKTHKGKKGISKLGTL